MPGAVGRRQAGRAHQHQEGQLHGPLPGELAASQGTQQRIEPTKPAREHVTAIINCGMQTAGQAVSKVTFVSDSVPQVFDVLFKQYVNRMNFKMRMRKLNIRSIRAPSSVRLKLIELNALPQTSPVCGLIRISEMEQLSMSYGVTPPDVFYDVFLLKQLGQRVPGPIPSHPARPRKHPMALQSHLQPGSTSGKVRPGVTPAQGTPTFSSMMSSYSSDDVGTEPEMTLVISIPRQLTPFRPHPGADLGPQYPNMPVIVPNPSGTGATHYRSLALNLAKKITQKSRKFSSSSAAPSNRTCPACRRINPATKKRCQFCGEFLIGRPCPKCGTLNHNRTRECFRCNCSIPYAGEGVWIV